MRVGKLVSKLHSFLPDDASGVRSFQCASSLVNQWGKPNARDEQRGRGLRSHAQGHGPISSTLINKQATRL